MVLVLKSGLSLRTHVCSLLSDFQTLFILNTYFLTAHLLLRIALAILMHRLRELLGLMFPCLMLLIWRDWLFLRFVPF